MGATRPQRYEIEVAGCRRTLPVVEAAPGLWIAAFVLLGDVDLTEACAGALAALLERSLGPAVRGPGGAVLVGPEAKVIPLLHALAARLGRARYVVCRKSLKGYMRGALSVEVQSITTPGRQILVLDGADAERLRGRSVVLVDDVVSTGGTLEGLDALTGRAGARVVARVAVLQEGAGVPGVQALGRLPVWRGEAGAG